MNTWMTLEECHALEDELKRDIDKQGLTDKVDVYYSSTYQAINAYYEALYGHKFFEEVKDDRTS